jgi:ABC-2 type transport system permease protein
MTAVLDRPRHRASGPPGQSSALTGTLRLLRLYLRRDRIVLPLWVLLLSVPLSTVYVTSIRSVYPDPADRAGFVASIMASPAQRALYGNIYSDSVGSTALWKAGVFHALIGIAVILTVIRHTRGDEETGRTELLESTVVGRLAGLTAALALAFSASAATGLIGIAGLVSTGVPVAGSVAFGAALTGSGLVFAALAAVAAQLSASARTTRGIAFAAVRAIGYAGNGALSWLSPLGWALQVRPYAGERWWVLDLPAVTAIALTALAYLLLNRRDVGGGLLAERSGPGRASSLLCGPLGLAWRLQRGPLLAWAVGLSLYALLAGSITKGIGEGIGDNTEIREIVARLGGSTAMETAFITISFGFLGMVAAAQGVSATLRLHSEETAGRAEPLLAGSVGRTRWAASHLVFAVLGTTVTLMTAGVVAGTAYGLAGGDVAGELPGVLAAAAVQLPAVWLMAAIALALFGLAPRFAPAAWGVLVAVIALYLLGSVSGAPDWVRNISPFAHVPRVPGEALNVAPLLWLTGIAVVLVAAGLAGLRRRDLR